MIECWAIVTKTGWIQKLYISEPTSDELEWWDTFSGWDNYAPHRIVHLVEEHSK